MNQFEYDSDEEQVYDNTEDYFESTIIDLQEEFYELITKEDTFKTFMEKLHNHELYQYLVIDCKCSNHRTLRSEIRSQWNYVYENIINKD